MIKKLLLNEDYEEGEERLDALQKHRLNFELDKIEDEKGEFIVAVDVEIEEGDSMFVIIKGHWSGCKFITDNIINF